MPRVAWCESKITLKQDDLRLKDGRGLLQEFTDFSRWFGMFSYFIQENYTCSVVKMLGTYYRSNLFGQHLSLKVNHDVVGFFFLGWVWVAFSCLFLGRTLYDYFFLYFSPKPSRAKRHFVNKVRPMPSRLNQPSFKTYCHLVLVY